MKARGPGFWLALLALALIAMAIVFVPVFLIRPFVPQTPGSISTAFTLRRWSPIVTLVALLLGFVLVFRFWRKRPRLGAKIGSVLLVLPVLLAAWLSRQNHFEWMFNPLPNVSFARASDASFVADSDQVLAVQINGEAAAYPVRQIAYHHVIQDEIGGTPIVATY